MGEDEPTLGGRSEKKAEASLVRSSAAERLTFLTASGKVGVDAVHADENAWPGQTMTGPLPDVDVRTISYHLKNAFADHELKEWSVIRLFRTTAEGAKCYATQHQDLSANIAVGYKVCTERAVPLRKWSAGIIGAPTIKGFAMDDDGWKFRVPPKADADPAWVRHFILHLAEQDKAGIPPANRSNSSEKSGDRPARSASSAGTRSLQRPRDVRRSLIEADLVDLMVVPPGQLLHSAPIPEHLWFVRKSKAVGTGKAGPAPTRDRREMPLSIDAGKLGTLIARFLREPTCAGSENFTSAHHACHGDLATTDQGPMPKIAASSAADAAGSCGSVSTTGIAAHSRLLTPCSHGGAEELEAEAPPPGKGPERRRRAARRALRTWRPCAENALSSAPDRRLAKDQLDPFRPDFSRCSQERPKTETGKFPWP